MLFIASIRYTTSIHCYRIVGNEMYEYFNAKFSKIKCVILACNIFTCTCIIAISNNFEGLVALCILLERWVYFIQIEHCKVYPVETIFLLLCTLVCKKKHIIQVWSYNFILKQLLLEKICNIMVKKLPPP